MPRLDYLLFLATFLQYASPAHALLDCSTPPLVLPIRDYSFSDGIGIRDLSDAVGVTRGIPLSLGTPGQLEAMLMTFTLNNTRLRNSADCLLLGDSSAIIACKSRLGSTFSPDSSKTWVSAAEDDWNVTTIDIKPIENGSPTIVHGYDIAKSAFIPTIPDLPFEVWSDASAPYKSALGFGSSSSFMQKLEDLGAIPSKVIGFFHGSRTEIDSIDGEVVIGGFNQARMPAGAGFTEFQLGHADIQCPLPVMIKDVVLGNDQGSFSIMPDEGGAIPACIDSLQDHFTFNSAMYAIWANLTQHTFDAPGDGPTNYTDQTFPSSAEPLIGNLTITLGNGYTSVIPHYELLSHERGRDTMGKRAPTDTSRLIAAVGTGLNDYGSNMPLLGNVFLSQNYLVVDYAKEKFGLAPAVHGPGNHIQTVCESPERYIDEAPYLKTQKPKRKIGKIIGGVIGAVAGLLMATFGVIKCCLHRARRPRSKTSREELIGYPMENPNADHPAGTGPNTAGTLPAQPASGHAFSQTTAADTNPQGPGNGSRNAAGLDSGAAGAGMASSTAGAGAGSGAAGSSLATGSAQRMSTTNTGQTFQK